MSASCSSLSSFVALEKTPDRLAFRARLASTAVAFVLSRPGLFLNSTSDATVLPRILEAAQGTNAAPAEASLLADVADLGMQPLFVRGVSDTI